MQDDENVNDKLLLLRLREGNRAAFDALYERHWKLVFSAAYKRLQNEELAKNVTQEVFVHLWNRSANAGIENLPTYLFTAVRNKVFTHLARESSSSSAPGITDDQADDADYQDTAFVTKELSACANR